MTNERLAKELEQFLSEYEDLKNSYRNYTNNSEVGLQGLVEFESRFVDLKFNMRPIYNNILSRYNKRSDKQTSAIKMRIAYAIYKEELLDEETGDPRYEKCSINQAEKFAYSSPEYAEFLDQQAEWKQHFSNILEVRDTINLYINEIKDRLKII